MPKRKTYGVYYHSSPPRVMNMNNQITSKLKSDDRSRDAFNIKPSNIRIWLHDKDISKLSRVLWEGQGMRLRTETSSHPKMKRFLDAVPYVLNVIKDTHSAVIENDIELLKSKIAPPVPSDIINSKDGNGLTILHKAAGLAHTEIVEYILASHPQAITEIDLAGRTALHWAASAKNNDKCLKLLVQGGVDEQKLDHKQKLATFYKHRVQEIDRPFLNIKPEAPRIPPGVPPGFEWSVLLDEPSKPIENSTKQNDFNQPGMQSFRVLENVIHSKPKVTIEPEDVEPEQVEPIVSNHMASLTVPTDIENEPLATATFNNLTTEEQAVMAAISDGAENHKRYLSNRMSAPSSPLLHSPKSPKSPSKLHELKSNTIEPSHEMLELQENVQNTEEDEESMDEDDEHNAGSLSDHSHEVYPDQNKSNDLRSAEEAHISLVNTDIENHMQTNIDNVGDGSLENGQNHSVDNLNHHEICSPENTTTKEVGHENGENYSTHSSIESHTAESGEEIEWTATDERDTELEDEHVVLETISDTDTNNVEETESMRTQAISSSSGGVMKELDHLNDEINVIESENNNNDNNINNDDDEDDEDDDKNDDKNDNDDDMVEKDAEVTAKYIDNENLNNNLEVVYPSDPDPIYIDNTVDYDYSRKETTNDHEILKIDDNESHKSIDNHDVDNENVESPSPALEIMGIVQGDADIGQLQSQGSNLHEFEKDDYIQGIINSGDMEQLATLVLNGEGSKLVGMESDQLEIQAFLSNVPAYMNKIRRVHIAAREGSSRDLQSALDRRKFAIAKDSISPNGATPLHVATLFGHAGIVRYLAGRFPETTSAVDSNGRTALHYAAVINDNGHFYNLLVHLGANPKAQDKAGFSAVDYSNRKHSDETSDLFTHKGLLHDFGASDDLADEMLSDQEDVKEPAEVPVFRTEEGRYLATSLGDPLIKGLTEVANMRPEDPIGFLANYLYNVSNANKSHDTEQRLVVNNNHTVNEMNNNMIEVEKPNLSAQQPRVSNNFNETPPSTAESTSTIEDRDEHGQSILHFACARSHGRNGLLQLIEESNTSIAYRDELYRTARDVALQASKPENAKELDRYLLNLAERGDTEAFSNLIIEGYDHILDVTDIGGKSIVEVAQSRGHTDLVQLFGSINDFEEARERLHSAIRKNDLATIKEIIASADGSSLAKAKNYYGRSAMHIAILKENEDIVELLASNFKHTLRTGDNLEKTPLHYAMGVNSVESISRIIIQRGAKRVIKDLKGRQPSYYFMNKAEILRLQEEEEDQ